MYIKKNVCTINKHKSFPHTERSRCADHVTTLSIPVTLQLRPSTTPEVKQEPLGNNLTGILTDGENKSGSSPRPAHLVEHIAGSILAGGKLFTFRILFCSFAHVSGDTAFDIH